MRRPPIACQRAVQSLQFPATQHVWVPDHVLSSAIHGFFHSSYTQQKRHGSNVPGPLEARKRDAKRRMTASAGYYPHDNFPISFSFGALFGNRPIPETSWTYEPPSLPRTASGEGPASPAWEDTPVVDVQPRGSAIDTESLNHDTKSLDHDPSQYIAQQTAVRADQSNNFDTPDALPSTSVTEHTLTGRNELEQSLNNFKVGFAAAQSGNFTSAMKGILKELFEQNLPSAPLLCQYFTAVLQYLDSVGGTPVPVLRVLLAEDGRLLRSLHSSQSPSDCEAFLHSLDSVWKTEHKRRKPFVHRALRIMAQSAIEASKSTTEAEDYVLLHLIECMDNRVPHTQPETLLRLASNLSESDENKVLLSFLDEANGVEDNIISTVRNVAASPVGFASTERALFYMPRHRLLNLVPAITLRLANDTTKHDMETWLLLVQQVDGQGSADKKLLDAALVSLAGTLGNRGHGKGSSYPGSPKHFVQAVLLCQGLDLQVFESTEALPRVQDVLANVLVQLRTQPEAYTAFTDLALPLVARHAGLTTLLLCLRTMDEKQLPLSTQVDLASIIADERAGTELSTASYSLLQAQNQTLIRQDCNRLIETLSQDGYTPPTETEEERQFRNVLFHARVNRALPVDRRDAVKNLPVAERVVLVHQLAHHYSTDTTLTQRAAWRCMFYLYNYLKSNSLPIGPLFTKSIAHISITRPLMANQFVSVRRLIWVCHLVAKVEGDAVAARLESTFSEQRGYVLRHAKQNFVGAGGNTYAKVHIASMKRLGLV